MKVCTSQQDTSSGLCRACEDPCHSQTAKIKTSDLTSRWLAGLPLPLLDSPVWHTWQWHAITICGIWIASECVWCWQIWKQGHIGAEMHGVLILMVGQPSKFQLELVSWLRSGVSLWQCDLRAPGASCIILTFAGTFLRRWQHGLEDCQTRGWTMFNTLAAASNSSP